MRSFHCVVAMTSQEIADAQRVRHQVYVEEEGLLQGAANASGREIDARDAWESTLHLLVYAEDEPVGTVRLLLPNSNGSSESSLGLPLEASFDLSTLVVPDLWAAEVTRFCVLRRYRHTGVTSALFAGLYEESVERGITHWVAGANMETDVPEDAAIAQRLAAAAGLVSPRFCARAHPSAPPRTARLRPLYTAEQRRRAAAGDLDGLELPRTLSLFANRMGARFIGPPVYEERFGVFALPLVSALADVAAAPVSRVRIADMNGAPRRRAAATG
jgi:putative hemolysin